MERRQLVALTVATLVIGIIGIGSLLSSPPAEATAKKEQVLGAGLASDKNQRT